MGGACSTGTLAPAQEEVLEIGYLASGPDSVRAEISSVTIDPATANNAAALELNPAPNPDLVFASGLEAAMPTDR